MRDINSLHVMPLLAKKPCVASIATIKTLSLELNIIQYKLTSMANPSRQTPKSRSK